MTSDSSSSGSCKDDTRSSAHSTSRVSEYELSSRGEDDSRQTKDMGLPDVAIREQKAVGILKGLVCFMLIVTVAAVGTGVYLFAEKDEQNIFESTFRGTSSELLTVALERADRVFEVVDNLAITATSAAAANQNTSWPFTIIPDWAAKAENLEKLVGIDDPIITVIHVVEDAQREKWTEFMGAQLPLLFADAEKRGNLEKSTQEMLERTMPFPHYYGNLTTDKIEEIVVPASGERPSLIAAEMTPYELNPIGLTYINYDLQRQDEMRNLFSIVNATRRPAISLVEIVDPSGGDVVVESQIMQPIYETNEPNANEGKVVGISFVMIRWTQFIESLLLINDYSDIYLVLESSCRSGTEADANDMTFRIDGDGNVEKLPNGQTHDSGYNYLKQSRDLVDLGIDPSKIPDGLCVPKLTLNVYPSAELEERFQTSKSLFATLAVVVIFVITSLTFLLYDYCVGQRQRKVMERIQAQENIVSNVFPSAIRDRLYAQDRQTKNKDEIGGAAPLADLFPSTTVIFADIVGFTAWASAREPDQVFILLESLYSQFDKIAYQQNVFKVETVGDCYVAVAGLPEPNEAHAVAACKFARHCVVKMNEMTAKLEVTLGPDTADLQLRVGIHSGQVTAGVLRGERSRFQLFGDTMNTAARMESSGEPNKIQLSQTTADLLTGGLKQLIMPRSKKVAVKGKGEMQTYWLNFGKAKKSKSIGAGQTLRMLDETVATDSSNSIHTEDDSFDVGTGEMTKQDRLVEWNVEVLGTLLQQIIASRSSKSRSPLAANELAEQPSGATVLDEFIPIIPLKRFGADDLARRRDVDSVDIGDKAKNQLRSYLTNIAMMYQDNPFHNFEHASHVTASVKKLLKRIVKVDEGNGLLGASENVDLVDLAGHSYGITSDPLTQFAVVFSAVIHDVDHPGVPNSQLVKENTRNAQIYKKSIAEQNSVDLAWEMLMAKEYNELRACIYNTEEDRKRFRQLVVNTVLATDIVDKELQALRKARWETAFSQSATDESSVESDDRKATIVIEHLIQASDVSHTMQHWHIYKSWNEKFFMECYGAFKAGRADVDPSINWYKGEVGFFEFYVIPLAKKLDNCGVFGVSSHEYLNYATANRDEWVREGESIVQQFLEKYEGSNSS
ncbi:unnamed protein product [Cylindrotheca closterium]|uniref:Phosphodiesterase n=1 Tax=Cylindrotheca closterium TaxID=2856 RepID=A0AAD2CEA6_9STRA|nr:unnamed protein product [Cylindrotheca closterium]